jgi:hypothetical protein
MDFNSQLVSHLYSLIRGALVVANCTRPRARGAKRLARRKAFMVLAAVQKCKVARRAYQEVAKGHDVGALRVEQVKDRWKPGQSDVTRQDCGKRLRLEKGTQP